MTLALYRCRQDGRLLRRRDITKGECLGHQIALATQGSIIEWLVVLYWKLKGEL